MQEVLVKHLFKLAQEKVWLGELTVAVEWDVKQENKQKLPVQTKKTHPDITEKLLTWVYRIKSNKTYKHDESERLKARNLYICWYLSFYEQSKFCAQLS